MTRQEAERQEAREQLRGILKPGDTVWTILRHVSRSGMSRRISLVVFEVPPDSSYDPPGPRDITWLAGKALGCRRHDDGGLVVGGCGMDMGFHIVYNLSRTLFPSGFTCIGNGCPASDHPNGDRNREPHKHGNGGYALQQRWL